MHDAVWATVRSEHVEVQMPFMMLNPRSHAAVPTGIMSIANGNFLNCCVMTAPLLSLNSRNASFVAENGRLNFTHIFYIILYAIRDFLDHSD